MRIEVDEAMPSLHWPEATLWAGSNCSSLWRYEIWGSMAHEGVVSFGGAPEIFEIHRLVRWRLGRRHSETAHRRLSYIPGAMARRTERSRDEAGGFGAGRIRGQFEFDVKPPVGARSLERRK